MFCEYSVSPINITLFELDFDKIFWSNSILRKTNYVCTNFYQYIIWAKLFGHILSQLTFPKIKTNKLTELSVVVMIF